MVKLTRWPPASLLPLLEVCVVGILAVYGVGLLYLSGLRHDNHIQEGRESVKVNESEWLGGN